MPPTNDQCQKMTLNNFKVETEALLNELNAYHESKKRLIEHTFQKLFDNIPVSIKDLPINQCMSDYATILKEIKENRDSEEMNSEIIDESINDIDDVDNNENNHGGAKNITNLTSTVKKLNPKKLELHKKHLDNIINEQSAIQETDGNNENTLNADEGEDFADNGTTPVCAPFDPKKKEERLKDEDYKCKIIYFYKNCTKVIADLEDLENIDTDFVHENSIKDLERIRQTFYGKSKKVNC